MFDVYYVFFIADNKEILGRVVGDESMFEFCHEAYEENWNINGLVKIQSESDDEWCKICHDFDKKLS